jgi:hypothetical protein
MKYEIPDTVGPIQYPAPFKGIQAPCQALTTATGGKFVIAVPYQCSTVIKVKDADRKEV